jgi:hypothetical protein
MDVIVNVLRRTRPMIVLLECAKPDLWNFKRHAWVWPSLVSRFG